MNKRILAYIEQYEVGTAHGKDCLEVAERVYAELINDGFLPDELVMANEVADILLIDYRYEFASEDAVNGLAKDIALSAFLDVEFNKLDDEAVVEEEIIPEVQYAVMIHTIDLVNSEKSISLMPVIFNELDEIRVFIAEKGMASAIHYLEEELDAKAGIIDILGVEDAYEIYQEIGIAGEIVADQIPEDAVAVASIVHVMGEYEEIDTVEMIAIYEVLNFQDVIGE